ncbi:hypothetical protein P8452_52095 [Trifolium repens]|nr:hypothetical protein P8452_52095 [Trifolium repens]
MANLFVQGIFKNFKGEHIGIFEANLGNFNALYVEVMLFSISPSHHLINPFNFTCFQFQVIFAETLIDSKDEFLQKYLVVYDFVRTNISSGEVLKQKAFKHADLDASNVELWMLQQVKVSIHCTIAKLFTWHAQGVHNVEREKNHDAYLSDDLFDANLTPLGVKQVVAGRILYGMKTSLLRHYWRREDDGIYELKRHVARLKEGDEEAIPAVFEAVLQRYLTGKPMDADQI